MGRSEALGYPSTMLRMVPLPICDGEERERRRPCEAG